MRREPPEARRDLSWLKAPVEQPKFGLDDLVRPYGPSPRDSGGMLYSYYASLYRADFLGTEVRIRGTCISACTVYLGARHACVEPDAMVWFHAAHNPDTKEIDKNATAAMAQHWPPKVREWAREAGVHRSIAFTRRQVLTGKQLIRMGVRKCG